MGNYIVTIQATGGHGQDRNKKNGESIDFETPTKNSPEEILIRAIDELKKTGNNVTQATMHHWPNSEHQVVDDLLNKKRMGDF